MASKLTSTILKQANEIEDVNERANWLRENATYAVRGLLNFNFHPDVKFLLPEGGSGIYFIFKNKIKFGTTIQVCETARVRRTSAKVSGNI